MEVTGAARYTGQSVPRVEDDRILTGRGRYVADITRPGMLHAAFVRSHFPHAAVRITGTEAALRVPGVVAVLTAADLDLTLQNPVERPGYARPVFSALAGDRARYVGDPLAVVLAESRYAAEDGCEAVEVDVDPIAPIATIDDALNPALPPMFDDIESNVFFTETVEHGDLAAFEDARIVTLAIHPQRVAPVPMEGRCGLAEYDPGTGELTYHATHQAPHNLRSNLMRILGQPADLLRVIAPDVGGSFGQKTATFREDVVICAAARRLGRPVRWVEDRMENMSAGTHARDERMEVRAAVDPGGMILALDVAMTLDQGAYPAYPTPSTIYGASVKLNLPSSTRIRGLRFTFTAVSTNKATYGAYRGPWAVETLVRELLIDKIARELGLDVVQVRRRNLISAEDQPMKMLSGPTLDGVTSAETLERAVELIDYAGFRARQEQGRREGRLLGLGFSTYIEAAPGPPDFFPSLGFDFGGERAHAKLEPDGRLTVMTAQAPHGQGTVTTLRQVTADEFGVPLDHVRVIHGDTSLSPFSLLGTGGSRAATMGSGAALEAARAVKAKVLHLAGGLLEISPDDLEIVDAVVAPKGDPEMGLPLAQIAAAAYYTPHAEEHDLRSSAEFAGPSRGGWSGGTHACIVELDPETGQVRIDRYLVVEDCGPMINPAIVEGQVRGGVAQGIGLALLEHAAYDEHGNFLSGTFMNYLVPTAMEIPAIEIDHVHGRAIEEVPYKGVGEGGTIAAPPAVLNAVADALGGATITELPLTPERVLALLDARRGNVAPG